MDWTNILLLVIIVLLVVIGWIIENIEEHLRFFRNIKEEELKHNEVEKKILKEVISKRRKQ